MPRKKRTTAKRTRRVFDKGFRQEAVQMLLDGHSARLVADRLGLSSTSILYRWKKDCVDAAGPVAMSSTLACVSWNWSCAGLNENAMS